MMNPSAYGPPPPSSQHLQQQQQPQQQQQQQQQGNLPPQYAQSWQQQQPPARQLGPPPVGPPSAATNASMNTQPGQMPPMTPGGLPRPEMVNGNYAQQLVGPMGGLNINSLKHPSTQPQDNFQHQPNQNMPPTGLTSNNNVMNGPTGMMAPMPQTVSGGPNQMTVNSASVPGLPHMPPPKSSAAPPLVPMTSGQLHASAAAGPPQMSTAPSSMANNQMQYPPQMQQMPPRSAPMTSPSNYMPPPMQAGPMQPPPVSQPSMPPMPGQMANNLPANYPPQPGHYPPQPPPQQHQQQSQNYNQQGLTGYPGQMLPPQPGQPPMPSTRQGYNNQPPVPNMYQQPQMQQQPQYQQQPQRRLDPDQMPNPIQVMVENQRNAGGAFVTNQPGLLPPLVTTKYVVQDQGNSSPRLVRSSLYCIPATAELLKTTALPFTLIASPFARSAEGERDPLIVNFGELGPIRCNRCKAYMSPNMQFIDAGRRFQCLMCKVTTEVPTEYFQHLDHTGQRVDKYERPELLFGSYEFLATKDYCRNNSPPQVPAFIFVIEVSYNTIKSGLVHLLCSQVKQILKHLPVDQGQEKSNLRVGFITYNSSVHFYNIKSSLAQPQMMVVGDVQDMFMPLLDGFLCHPEESEVVIDALMEQIPKMFIDTKETETVLYPAIQAGLEALKASNCAGKLLVFNSTLPIAEAPGKLKSRDDRKLLGTEKEKTVLTPQCQSYNLLGQECVQNGCSVDLFVFNNSYIDLATIGQVSRLTGGEIFKYTYFQADTDGKRLIEDIIKNVSRPIAFDAVMRVRTSAGIRATDFYGHFFMTNTTDVELASIDATKSIAIEIKHDDKLPPEENAYLQIALLYTSCSGQRRLRVLNLALRVTVTIADVFKSCDLDAMMLFFAKQACVKLMELTPKAVKDSLIHRSAQILACYRKHCTSPTSAGQLILPEGLKLLPLYLSCLLKNDAISGGSDMTLDDRSYVIQFVLTMDLNMSVNYLYPRFIPIHNLDPSKDDFPMPMRCTHEKMSEDGAYILENGVYLFVWLGQSVSQAFIQPVFGVQCTQQVNTERFAITADTPLAQRVRSIIETIMSERSRYMRITCVRQNDKLESVFRHFLIEDRGTDGSASYVDFLCHMHKEIKDLLS